MTDAIKEFGRVDIVIANAGTVDKINWQKCIELNLVSLPFTLQYFSTFNSPCGR